MTTEIEPVLRPKGHGELIPWPYLGSRAVGCRCGTGFPCPLYGDDE